MFSCGQDNNIYNICLHASSSGATLPILCMEKDTGSTQVCVLLLLPQLLLLLPLLLLLLRRRLPHDYDRDDDDYYYFCSDHHHHHRQHQPRVKIPNQPHPRPPATRLLARSLPESPQMLRHQPRIRQATGASVGLVAF